MKTKLPIRHFNCCDVCGGDLASINHTECMKAVVDREIYGTGYLFIHPDGRKECILPDDLLKQPKPTPGTGGTTNE